MNHLINSNVFRVYYQSKWTHQWYSSFLNYKYHYNNDLIITKFLKNYFDFYFFKFLKKNKKLLAKKRKLRNYILNSARCYYLTNIQITRKWGYVNINLDLFVGVSNTKFRKFIIVYPKPRKLFRHRCFPFQNIRARINPDLHFLIYPNVKLNLIIPKYLNLAEEIVEEEKIYIPVPKKQISYKSRFSMLIPVFKYITRKFTRKLKNKKKIKKKLKMERWGVPFQNILFHQLLKMHILYNLKKLLHMPVFLNFNWLNVPTAKVITRYITRHLRNRHTLNQIVYSFIRDLFKHFRSLKGLLIKCTGRITKRQRASCRWFRVGTIHRSNIMTNLDYSQEVAVLKYGVVSVKVWLYSDK